MKISRCDLTAHLQYGMRALGNDFLLRIQYIAVPISWDRSRCCCCCCFRWFHIASLKWNHYYVKCYEKIWVAFVRNAIVVVVLFCGFQTEPIIIYFISFSVAIVNRVLSVAGNTHWVFCGLLTAQCTHTHTQAVNARIIHDRPLEMAK